MSAFVLKLIALSTMMIDHVGYEFSGFFDGYPLRVIGRIALPIYVFLIAEGCRHTRDLNKFLIRLGAFALISEIPFDLFAAAQPFRFSSQNIFFTLFFGVASVWGYERLKSLMPVVAAAILPAAAGCAAAELMHTDYGFMGVLAVFLCYYLPERWMQLASLSLLLLCKYNFTPYFVSAAIAVAILSRYNGKRGYPMKWAFYAVYPVHLLILYSIYVILTI